MIYNANFFQEYQLSCDNLSSIGAKTIVSVSLALYSVKELTGRPFADRMRSKTRSEMKKELMEILACPLCKGDLQLNIEQEDEKEVISGSLYCSKCDQSYPIVDAIPNLLPPELRD